MILRRATCCTIALLLGGAASAAIPLELPEGEHTDPWRQTLGGVSELDLGTAEGPGPWVRLEAGADRWRLVVRDSAGEVNAIAVDPPTTAERRQAIAALAVSLARPMELPALPVEHVDHIDHVGVISEAPREAVAKPPTAPPPPPPEVPPETVARVGPPPIAPPVGVDLIPRARIQPFATAWTGVSVRPGDGVAATGTVAGGVEVSSARFGLGFSGGSPTRVADAGRVWTVDLVGGAWWAPPALPVAAGGGLGAGLRQFSDDDGMVASAWLPIVHASAFARLDVARQLEVLPMVEARYDLQPIDLEVDRVAADRFGRINLLFGVGIGFPPRSSR